MNRHMCNIQLPQKLAAWHLLRQQCLLNIIIKQNDNSESNLSVPKPVPVVVMDTSRIFVCAEVTILRISGSPRCK